MNLKFAQIKNVLNFEIFLNLKFVEKQKKETENRKKQK